MFNTMCYFLNFISPTISSTLRFAVFSLCTDWQYTWSYDNGPQAGYIGGVDVPFFGTVAFLTEKNILTFVW